jgi:hypothetical protein
VLEGFGRRLAPSPSVRTSKNWMISRQGSQLNMLRDAAAFDIAFRQPGQSGFIEMEVLEIEVIEIEVLEILCCRNRFWVRERFSVRHSHNTTNQGCFFGCGERC